MDEVLTHALILEPMEPDCSTAMIMTFDIIGRQSQDDSSDSSAMFDFFA